MVDTAHLKKHMYVGRKFDALRVGKAEHLVVVEHRVHVLDPDGVDGAIADDPLMVGGGALYSDAQTERQHAVVPLQRLQVHLAVQLADTQTFRVHGVLVDRLILRAFHPLIKQPAIRISQYLCMAWYKYNYL